MLFTTPATAIAQVVTISNLPASVRRSAAAHVISEELFHDALIRERKRADRFEEAFALVMITIDRRRLEPGGRGAAGRVDLAIATRPPT